MPTIFGTLDGLVNFAPAPTLYLEEFKVADLTKKYGEWAIVTGATSGIGKSFAEQLARNGVNVVLVSRTESVLKSIEEELRHMHGIQTRILPLDLTKSDHRRELETATADLDIGILINNAAVEQFGSFVAHDAQELRDAIELNVVAPSELGQWFGRRFVERGRGAIIFLAGSIGYQAVPHLASYAAAKAHQLHLAEALHYELRPHGIDVLALSPGITKTPMMDRIEESIHFRRIGLIKSKPEKVAQVGLRQLGRRSSVAVGAQSKILAVLMKYALTRGMGAWLFGVLVRYAFIDKILLSPIRNDNKVAATDYRQRASRQLIEA